MRTVIVLIIILVLAGALAAIAHGVVQPAETVIQPIAFNHKVHLEEASLQCISCHTDAPNHVWAGLPNTNACLECHDIDDEETQNNPEKAKLIPYADSERSIPWHRVAIVRPDVFFSHRRHVTAGGIECLECHTGQNQRTSPPRKVSFVMRMNDCLACHKKRGVTTDCLACHR